ncbi:MAG: hypothetical protein LUC43_05230 [Burkholderiales bacterium]|nr:hypothetical protein [Burkholderiales bacterium]
MKDEQNKFLNDKIDRFGLWMKKSLDFELDQRTLENLKTIAGKSTKTVENLMAIVLANLDKKQPVEKGITFQALFTRLRRVLPQLTEEDAKRIFRALKEIALKEVERRRNNRR